MVAAQWPVQARADMHIMFEYGERLHEFTPGIGEGAMGLRWAGGQVGRVDRVRQAREQVGRVGRADSQVRKGAANVKTPWPEVEEGATASEEPSPRPPKTTLKTLVGNLNHKREK